MSESTVYPKLRDDLIVSEQETDGQKFFILKDPITLRYFRLREPEYFIIQQFDGVTDCEAAAARFQDKFNLNVPAAAVEKFAEKVESLYFFEGSRAEYEISSSRYKNQTGKSLFSRMLFIKLKAFDPQKLLDALYTPLRFLFHPLIVGAMMAAVIFGFFLYFLNFDAFKFSPADLFHVTSIIIIIVSLSVIILIHEFAHALTCRHFGGRVHEMGFLLLYFQICFYANLSDSWLFKEKSHRLAVIWAGLFFQMVLFSLAVFGWRLTLIGSGINELFWLTANVCFIMLLFNVNPLIKLDGYYVLSEMTNIPNLRSRAFGYMSGIVRRIIGIAFEKAHATAREKRIFIVYTLFAGIYSFGLIAYMAWIAYGFLVRHLGGFGFVLFLALIAIIFKAPVSGIVRFMISREVARAMFAKPRNLIIGSILLVVIVVVVFFIPFPHQVGGDVVISPSAEYTIYHMTEQGRLELTLRTSGVERSFSSEHIMLTTGDLAVLRLVPLVSEGDTIRAGDTLATILSSQVSTSLESAQAELQRLQNEIALAKAPPKPEEVASAQATVNAVKAQVEQLTKDIDRNKSLYEKKLISNQELEQSESALNVAQSTLEEAKAKLKLVKSPPKPEEIDILESKLSSQKATIKYLSAQEAAQAVISPIDGRVVAYYRKNMLLKVADLSRVEVVIPITDNFLDLVTVGAVVNVKARTFAARLFTGEVVQISGSAEAGNFSDNRARFPVYALLDNPQGILKDGMSGYAKISCGKSSLYNIILNRLKAYLRVEFWSWW